VLDFDSCSGSSTDNPVAKERSPWTVQSLPAEILQDMASRQCLIPKYLGDIGAKDETYTMAHFHSGLSVDYVIVCHIPPR
jgi:hypothetical protein